MQESSSLSAKGRLILSKYLKALLTGRPAGHHATWYPKHLILAKPNLSHKVALLGTPVIHSFLVFNINISKKLTCAKNKKC